MISATDINLSAVAATLNSAPYVSGSTISAGGAYTLGVQASDKAGNISTRAVSFTLNPPPAKPGSLSVSIEEEKTAVIRWESPSAGVALYKVYKDGLYLGPANAADRVFRDTGYSAGAVHVYEVAAVDSAGRGGERAMAEVLPVSLALSGYGSYQSGAEALNRGFFDSVRFNISNKSTRTVQAGPLSLAIGSDAPVSAQEVSIPAGLSAEISAVVFTSTSAPDSVSAVAVLTLPRSGDAAVSISGTFSLAVRNPASPVVEIYPEALVRGTYSNVRLKLNNRGSAPLDLVTARLSGSKTVPGGSMAVELKTAAGFTLSRAELAQTAGAAIAWVSGEQLYFISIPAGGSFTSEPLRPAVPADAGLELEVKGFVSGFAHSLAYFPLYSQAAFTASKTMTAGTAAPYTATISPDRQVYDRETVVKISGRVTDTWGNPLGGVPFLVTAANKGYERQFTVTASSSGNYSVEFTPGPGEAGVYELSARHPDYIGEAAHSSFSIVGMGFGWAYYDLTMARNSSFTFEAEFTNTGETPVEALTASVETLSGSGVSAAVPVPSAIAAGMRYKLPVTVNALADASETAELVLKIRESHGFERTLPIHVKTVPAQVIARVTPQSFEIGMLAGETRTQSVTVENIGFSTWTGVQVSAPTLGWARIEGLQNMLGDIGPGGNASFTIVFEPPSGLSNGNYAQNPLVEITGGGATSVPVNAGIVITSSRKGGLMFNVASADIPAANPTGRLGNADMRLTSMDISGLAMSAKTDSNGLARFEDVPSGRYMYKAEASGYNQTTGMVTVEPGIVKTVDVFMPTTMVTYSWKVTPTTIQDKYDITLDMTFRTDVPAPAIIIDPPVINLTMQGGQTAYAQYTVKNKGLVSAFDFRMEYSGSDPAVKIELPFTEIAELKAGQSVVVPVKITLEHASCHSAAIQHRYRYSCENGITAEAYGQPVNFSLGDSEECGGGGGGVTGGIGGGWGGGSGGTSYVAAAISNPVPVQLCPSEETGGAGKYPNGGPNMCGMGADSATGNFFERLFSLILPGGSLGIDYTLNYDSLKGGLSDISGISLAEQPDGSVILTLTDGTKI
ncbi:MAG: carboxypeptidase-like regulatory domain-containing protein, partial [bacterium]